MLPGQDCYQVSSVDHVAKVFRSQGMIMTESHARAHEFGFGMPRAGANLVSKGAVKYERITNNSYSLRRMIRVMDLTHPKTAMFRLKTASCTTSTTSL